MFTIIAVVAASFTVFTASHPPHVERPTAGVSRSPIPLAAVGGEHPGAALAAATAAYEAQVNDAIYAQAAEVPSVTVTWPDGPLFQIGPPIEGEQ